MKKIKILLAATLFCMNLSAMAEMPKAAVETVRTDSTVLVDFGQAIAGIVKLHGLKGKGNVAVYYGESRETAVDTLGNKSFEKFFINHSQPTDWRLTPNHKLRFAYVVYPAKSNITLDAVSILLEKR